VDDLTRYNDVVMVGATPVTLDQHFYQWITLPEGQVRPTPEDLERQHRALAEQLRDFLGLGGRYAFRHPGLLPRRGVVIDCGLVAVEGIACRHLVDFDASTNRFRSIIDVFAGRAAGQPAA
jgi:hypothetical protein